MKRFALFSTILFALCALPAFAGCPNCPDGKCPAAAAASDSTNWFFKRWRHSQPDVTPVPTPTPTPTPEPQPTPAPAPGIRLANVIWVDTDHLPPWFGSVVTGDARKYLDQQGHQLQISTLGQAGADLAEYSAKLAELGAGAPVQLPLLMIGSAGKPLTWQPMPQTAADWIAAIQASEKSDAAFRLVKGQWRKLGACKKSDPKKLKAAWKGRTFGDDKTTPLVDPKDYCAVDLRTWAPEVLDQGQTSMCCPSGTSILGRTIRNICGFNDSELSVADLYRQGMILEDDYGDNGLQISTAATVLSNSGVCSTAYASKWSWSAPAYKAGYQADRQKHRIAKIYYCPDLASISSALQYGWPVAIGILVTNQFETPNTNAAGEAVIGPKRQRGGGGHCILVLGQRFESDGTYYLIQNSWGRDWGNSGLAWLHSSWVDFDFGAFCGAIVVTDPDDPFTVQTTPRPRPTAARTEPRFALSP